MAGVRSLSTFIPSAPMWIGQQSATATHSGCVQAAFSAVRDALELASGSGAHINYFAPHFPHIRFQPSDYDKDLFEAIRKMQAESANANVWDPVHIDLAKPETWPDATSHRYDVIFAINLFQVAPLAIAESVTQIAARVLKETGFLAIYGPFKIDGKYAAPSDEASTKSYARRCSGMGTEGFRDVEKPPHTWHHPDAAVGVAGQ